MKNKWVAPLGTVTVSMEYRSCSPSRPSPEPDAAAEHDRHLHDVQVVDEVGGQELGPQPGDQAPAQAGHPQRLPEQDRPGSTLAGCA